MGYLRQHPWSSVGRGKRAAIVAVGLSLVAGATVGLGAAVEHMSSGGPKSLDVGDRKYVALTIDDGPDERFTPRVLDLLERYGYHATFFLTGQNATAHPDLVRREQAQGEQIGNHTFTHPHTDTLTAAGATHEVQATQDAIGAITGSAPTLFRPPRGQMTPALRHAVQEAGLTSYLWSVCLEHKGERTPQQMADRVMGKVKPGSIILTHDGILDRSKSVDALAILLRDLSAEGYQVVTLGELEQLSQSAHTRS